jgi:hypothetical protein
MSTLGLFSAEAIKSAHSNSGNRMKPQDSVTQQDYQDYQDYYAEFIRILI